MMYVKQVDVKLFNELKRRGFFGSGLITTGRFHELFHEPKIAKAIVVCEDNTIFAAAYFNVINGHVVLCKYSVYENADTFSCLEHILRYGAQLSVMNNSVLSVGIENKCNGIIDRLNSYRAPITISVELPIYNDTFKGTVQTVEDCEYVSARARMTCCGSVDVNANHIPAIKEVEGEVFENDDYIAITHVTKESVIGITSMWFKKHNDIPYSERVLYVLREIVGHYSEAGFTDFCCVTDYGSLLGHTLMSANTYRYKLEYTLSVEDCQQYLATYAIQEVT